MLLNSDSIRRGWVVAAERQGCGVTALSSSSDFTNDGLPDILVGRTNGQLEVWGMDEAYEPHKVTSPAPCPRSPPTAEIPAALSSAIGPKGHDQGPQ